LLRADLRNRRPQGTAIALSTQWGVEVSTNNLDAAQKADLILIG